MCCINEAVGEGCVEWPAVESTEITYRINNGQLEASMRCRPGFQAHLNDSRRQPLQLTARCLSNAWDITPPQCFGMFVYTRHVRV